MDRLEDLSLGVAPETLMDTEISRLIGRSPRHVRRMARQGNWPFETETCRGGRKKKYRFEALPQAIKRAFFEARGEKAAHGGPPSGNAHPHTGNSQNGAIFHSGIMENDAKIIFPEAPKFLAPTLSRLAKREPAWSPERAVAIEDVRDPRVHHIFSIVQEALAVPPGWKKSKWIDAVALRFGRRRQSVYRYLARYERAGIAGICHRKSSRGKPKSWTPEAVDFWIGLVLKREHRKIDLKSLYQGVLLIEAARRGWMVGSYESARWWTGKRISPQLRAIQRGGARGLDNALPPIRRDYSDLAPFEILVGDQHKFDFWVTDDETGETFRPEGYFWQDLRTRLIYGGAVDRRYDSWLIGMALRIGIRAYGAFGSIYTDNGKPELSKYLLGILADMRALNLGWEREEDLPMDVSGQDPEEINPAAYKVGTHRKAIVKNAKAKMIEGTFASIERIMRGRFRLPGYAKELGGDIHENEVDEKELRRLAEAGRLPLFSEFVITLYQALDYYNRQKPHAGVLAEWTGRPKPKAPVPFDCLRDNQLHGWQPRPISEEAADLIFMAKARRAVSPGRVRVENRLYEHEALVELTGKTVDIRYNRLDPGCVMVFRDGRYVCTARQMEYSSMKDGELASRKIAEKRARQKKFLDQYRELTSRVPDFRRYSEASPLENAAAQARTERRKRAERQAELARLRTPEELEAEARSAREAPPKPAKRLPERPSVFINEVARHEWCLEIETGGGALGEEDRAWMEEYEARAGDLDRQSWASARELARKAAGGGA